MMLVCSQGDSLFDELAKRVRFVDKQFEQGIGRAGKWLMRVRSVWVEKDAVSASFHWIAKQLLFDGARASFSRRAVVLESLDSSSF